MSETTAPAFEAPALFSGYRTRGMTDDVTKCQRCGKAELRGTVIVEVLDPAGNVADVTYWGTTCAARYGKVKVSVVKSAVRLAELARAEAERAARQARHDAETAAYWVEFGPWLSERYGVQVEPGATQLTSEQTRALMAAGKAAGRGRFAQFHAMCEFEAETGRRG